MPLKALIFDIDGTFANTEEAHREAFNRIFQKYHLGWDWTVPLYGKLLKVTGGKERIEHFVNTHHPEKAAGPWPDGLNLGEWAARLHREKTEIYLRLMEQGGIELRPGVRRLVDEARREGVALAISTTTSRVNVTGLLAKSMAANALDWFAAVGTGESAPIKKPHPGVYQWVVAQLGLKPEECLALEDSSNGLRSALGAGIPTLITPSEYTAQDDFTGALAQVSDLGEPGQPSKVLAAPAALGTLPKGHVDLAWLRALHTQAQGA